MIVYYAYGWLESLALVLFSLALLGADWRVSRVVFAATLLWGVVAVVRTLPLLIGANTIVAIVILALLLAWLFARPLGKCLAAAVSALLLLLLVEATVLTVGGLVTDITASLYIWLLFGTPQIIALYVMALMARSRKFQPFH